MSSGKIGRVGAVNRDTPLAIEMAKERQSPRQVSPHSKGQAPRDPRVMDAARMYEKQFLREMVKAMRGTVSFSDVTKPTMAEEIYRGQLDEQYVESWGDGGGLGLADLIHDEIMEKIMSRASPAERSAGPIALSARDLSSRSIARVTRAPSAIERQAALRVEVQADAGGPPARVQAPFDSRVLATTKVDGKATVLLEHEGGLRSALIFDGVTTDLKAGDRVAKGAAVGILSPDASGFFWNLDSRGNASARTNEE